MKHKAYLSTGGTIDIELADDVSRNAFGGTSNAPRLEWLVGEHGEMINMQYCVALVPVLDDESSPEPNIIIDGDGDKWVRLAVDGLYHCGTANPRTLAEIKYAFDILEERDE